MTISYLTRILELHGINYEVVNGRVIADECYTLDGNFYTEQIDITNYTKTQLLDWLGY